MLFNDTLHNLTRGINERLFYRKVKGEWKRPHQPTSEYIEMLKCVTQHDLYEHLPLTTPITYQQFIDKYTGKKRMRYEKAFKKLLMRPHLSKRIAKISAFIKKELMALKSSKPFADMIPRIVQARTPVFNLIFGVFIRPIEDEVYRAIDKMFNSITKSVKGERTILKGLNSVEMAQQIANKWARIPNCVFIGLDASRFDQCCNKELLGVLHMIIEKCFKREKDRKRVRKLCKMTIKNSCVGTSREGIVRYELEGGLCSGEMTTAMTGCVIMSMCIYLFCRYHLKLKDFAVIDMGDDAGIFVDNKYTKTIETELHSFFHHFGLVMTMEEPVHKIEHIEFCQTKPVWDGEKYRMVRNPHTSTGKDASSLTPLGSRKETANYLNSVGQGGLALTGGIPMVQDYYMSMIRNSQALSQGKRLKKLEIKGGLYYISKRMNERYKPLIPPEARVSFYHAFKILPDMQIEMENYYAGINIEWCEKTCERSTVRTEFIARNVV